jgi:hypothetical protein
MADVEECAQSDVIADARVRYAVGRFNACHGVLLSISDARRVLQHASDARRDGVSDAASVVGPGRGNQCGATVCSVGLRRREHIGGAYVIITNHCGTHDLTLHSVSGII